MAESGFLGVVMLLKLQEVTGASVALKREKVRHAWHLLSGTRKMIKLEMVDASYMAGSLQDLKLKRAKKPYELAIKNAGDLPSFLNALND